MYINRVAFQDWFKKQKWYSKTKNKRLYPYQQLVSNYINKDKPYRGLLLYHGLGVGKTLSSIAICENNNNRTVIVMLPASLKQNYMNEIRKFMITKYKWIKVNTNELEKISKIKEKIGLDNNKIVKDVLDKYNHLWDFEEDHVDNQLETLNQKDQESLLFQIEKYITNRYNFINYNGISEQTVFNITNTVDKNYFDNKIVIIDEIHNFISRIIGNSKACNELYNLLMKSQSVRIVGLSGTPVINNPIEISYLLNLMRGFIWEKEFKFTKKSQFDFDKLTKTLQESPYIDYFDIRTDNSTITIGMLPPYFKKNADQNLIKDSEITKSWNDIINDALENIWLSEKVVINKTQKIYDNFNVLLPLEIDKFNEIFIDETTNTIKNPLLFSRRIQGLVSYYEVYNSDDYPEKHTHIVQLPMSEIQLQKYLPIRATEISQEKKKSKKESLQESNNVYKAFSRTLCNFVFPDKIDRPYPSKPSDLLNKEIDDGTQDAAFSSSIKDPDNSVTSEQQKELTKQQKYEKELKKAISKLIKDPDILTTQLQQYSPKMYEIREKIKLSPGPCLIYSNFRNVEGVGLMSEVLKKEDYWNLTVSKKNKNWYLDLPTEKKKMFIQFIGTKKDETQILLDIFNNNFKNLPEKIQEQLYDYTGSKSKLSNKHGELVKVLMITQSGAEGISLKNVRQVHIMEPYWNKIRLEQVTGRAIRANSHIDLPKEERHVDVFTYIMQFDELSKTKKDKSMTLDKFMTVDEIIANIAYKKALIIDSFLDIVKRSSIDCHLHQNKHKFNKPCFTPMEQNSDILYHKNIDNDIQDKDITTFKTKKRIKKIMIPITKDGITFVYDQNTQLVYNKDEYKIAIGKLKRTKNGKIIKIVFYNV